MGVTLQQIAQAAGVSRGTVDRALNNRGRINPQVAERIKSLAQEMGYHSNRAGKALAMVKKNVTIGVITQASETPFMETVLEGIRRAVSEVESMGLRVELRPVSGWDAEAVIRAMYELKKEGCSGIALMPTEDEELCGVIDEFVDEEIPVITFNSDIENSKRLCYVGYDTKQNGMVAAGLMAEIVPANGTVLMIAGYPSNHTHKEKADSFSRELQALRIDIRLLSVWAFDNANIIEMLTRDALETHRDLAAIYLVASGAQVVCRLLDEQGLSGRVKVISNDLTEENKRLLREGKMQFLLGQDGGRQGYEAVMLLFEKLFEGKELGRETPYQEIVIKTRYNL